MGIPELSVAGWIGWAAVAVVAIGWLVVSFQRQGRARATTAWVAALGLYVALLSLFVHLLRRALANDSTAGIVGFGFLVTFFSIGLLLAAVKLIGLLRGSTPSDTTATN